MLTLSSSDDSEKVNGFVLTLRGTCENAVPAGTTVLFIELDEEKYPTNTIAQTAAEAGQFTMNLAEPVTCPTGQKRHFVFKIEIPLDSKDGWYSSGTIGLSLKEIVTDGTLVIGNFPKNSPLYNLHDGSVVQQAPVRPPHESAMANRR
jgi:hypothetical protein